MELQTSHGTGNETNPVADEVDSEQAHDTANCTVHCLQTRNLADFILLLTETSRSETLETHRLSTRPSRQLYNLQSRIFFESSTKTSVTGDLGM